MLPGRLPSFLRILAIFTCSFLVLLASVSPQMARTMTYAAIVKAIWGDTDIGSTKKLQVNMANIRKKLGSRPGSNAYILNELGVGYRMIDEDNDTHNRENLE